MAAQPLRPVTPRLDAIWSHRLPGPARRLGQTVVDFLIGQRLAGPLPERVRIAIAAQEARSEILVCLVQGVAIVGFAVLYGVAPKAFPPSVPFEPIPWTLAIYGVFTALRLNMALRRPLPRWFLRLSVIVDIAVLMLTIWSFHLQYQAPPAIYLKAPTLMYVFILIALRALRLEAELVLLTGFAAAAGWLVLVAYAVFLDDMSVTRNFSVYAMSYSILIGAEIDKIVSIVVVTLLIALAVRRARLLLTSAVEQEQAASELSRYFAPEVARRIREAERASLPGDGVVRDAAILMCDLRGFTAGTRSMAAAETIALIAEYHGVVVPILQRHHGSIDKFLGDGVLASFGAVTPRETYACDALAASAALRSATAEWSAARRACGMPAFDVVVAVATGPVLFGPVGHDNRLEYTVMGQPVNLVAKLEKHAKTERALVLATGEALTLARAQGFRPRSVELRHGRVVKGVDDLLDLAVLG